MSKSWDYTILNSTSGRHLELSLILHPAGFKPVPSPAYSFPETLVIVESHLSIIIVTIVTKMCYMLPAIVQNLLNYVERHNR